MNTRIASLIILSILITKFAKATGYSGLNNELMLIYGLVVLLGIVSFILPKAINYLRSLFYRKPKELDNSDKNNSRI